MGEIRKESTRNSSGSLGEWLLNHFGSEEPIRHIKAGNIILDKNRIPKKILVINRGTARLVAESSDDIINLEILERGGIVGLASLICAKPLETVLTQTDLTATEIDWSKIQDLILKNQDNIGVKLTSTINPAEAWQLADAITNHHRRSGQYSKNLYGAILENGKVVCQIPSQKEHDVYIVARSNSHYGAFGTVVNADLFGIGKISNSEERFISLPGNMLEGFDYIGKNLLDTHGGDDEKDSNENAMVIEENYRIPHYGMSIHEDLIEKLQARRNQGIDDAAYIGEIFEILGDILDLPIKKDLLRSNIRQIGQTQEFTNLRLLAALGRPLGIRSEILRLDFQSLDLFEPPGLLILSNTVYLIISCNSDAISIFSPREGLISLSHDDLRIKLDTTDGPHDRAEKAHNSVTSILKLSKSDIGKGARFGVKWFYPFILKYRTNLVEIMIISSFIQLFGLAGPLIIQVVIDKVIQQGSLDSLTVLALALVVLTVFESVLGILRTIMFNSISNRIDISLGNTILSHLLDLPIEYFESSSVGEISTRLGELEKIRNFMTGQLVTTVLDAIFSVVYIAVMIWYSVMLTVVALTVVPIQILLTLFGTNLFQKQLIKVAKSNAVTQSHLVEVLSSILTVKAQNIETHARWTWASNYQDYVTNTFNKTMTASVVNESTQALQKFSQLLVLIVGATLVLNNEMTLGALIAFRIISGYVTQPLLRMSTVFQSFEEVKISFDRLGDIVNRNTESHSMGINGLLMPDISGHIEIANLSFAFSSESSKNVIDDIDLVIPIGSFVGLVGQSGCGKSTLTKLLMRIYEPSSGKIYIDNLDISKVNLQSLRSQIGYVPQEPILFSGTIRDNLTLNAPNATDADIISACKLSLSHDFIMNLPMGYNTHLSEKGASLSGGQKQRLTLARTLITNPRLLILDEATSALDYSTESMVVTNLIRALSDKTIIFITHRLSMAKDYDMIVMMDRGKIVEIGDHVSLIASSGPYAALYVQSQQG